MSAVKIDPNGCGSLWRIGGPINVSSTRISNRSSCERSTHLDAALLLIPRVGFLPPEDPRVVGAVEAVHRELFEDGLLYRHHKPGDARADGLPGSEGAFLACSPLARRPW